MRKAIPILFVAMLLLVSSLEFLVPGSRRVYASPGKHRSRTNAMALQAQVRAHLVNEDVIAYIGAMADLQVKYQEKVVLMADRAKMDPEQGMRLTADLTETLEELEQKAHDLKTVEDARGRRRRRHGFFSAVGRFFRDAGMFIGKTMGGVVYTTGKLTRFAIEDVAPVMIVDKVETSVEGRIDLLIERFGGKIGHQSFGILVEVAKAIGRRKRGGDPAESIDVVFVDDHRNVTIQYGLTLGNGS